MRRMVVETCYAGHKPPFGYEIHGSIRFATIQYPSPCAPMTLQLGPEGVAALSGMRTQASELRRIQTVGSEQVPIEAIVR